MVDKTDFFGDFGDIIGDVSSLIGGTDSVKGKTTGAARSVTEAGATIRGEGRKRLELDPLAISRIIEETLSGPDGLASIFAGEQNAGIFNSSVSAQAAGDLTAKLVGELAKLTAEEVTTEDRVQTQKQVTEQEQEKQFTQESSDKGVIKDFFDFLGF